MTTDPARAVCAPSTDAAYEKLGKRPTPAEVDADLRFALYHGVLGSGAGMRLAAEVVALRRELAERRDA